MLCTLFGHKYKNVVPAVFNLSICYDLEAEQFPSPVVIGKECEHCGHRFVARVTNNVPAGIEKYAADWIAKRPLPEFLEGGYVMLGKWNAIVPIKDVRDFIVNQIDAEYETAQQNMIGSQSVFDQDIKTTRALKLVVNNG
jgi:hypothetical protein